MSYTPSQQDVQSLVTLLAAGANGDKQALNQIMAMSNQSSFFACCAYIVANVTDPNYSAARMSAGYYIKNNMRNPACTSDPSVQQYVIQSLGDPAEGIRRAVATCISHAVRDGHWPPTVVDAVAAGLRGDQNAVAGALTAICDLCEDAVQLLGACGKTAQIIPAVVPFLQADQPAELRKKAVHAISILLEEAGMDEDKNGRKGATWNAMAPNAVTVLGFLAQMTQMQLDSTTMGYVIRSLVLLIPFRDAVAPSFSHLVSLMCQKSVDPDEDIRREAIEFWSAVLYEPKFAEEAFQHLPQIIPVLLDCMVYSEMELGMLQGTDNDWNVPDKAEDVNPHKYVTRHRAIGDEADDEDDDDVMSSTLRANAGLTLDKLAEHYGDQLLHGVLTIVDQKMSSNDWRQVEAAVMAVGAIAEGCYEGMLQYVGFFLKRLFQLLNEDSSHYLIKCMCLWTISQYSPWFGTEDGMKAEFLGAAMESILARMKSPSKRLQDAATSCLSVIADQLYENELEPYAVAIVQTVSDCFKHYQLKNLYLLLECVTSLCNHLGSRVAHEDCFNTLVAPMVDMWGKVPNDSPMLYPFFQCFASVCQALGSGIMPMAQQIFDRAFTLASHHVQARAQLKSNPNADVPEEDILVVSLDLLSGLSDALKGSIVTLIQGQPDFVNLLGAALNDPSPIVRQGSYAVIGDLATAAPLMVQSLLPNLEGLFFTALQDPENNTGEAANVAWILTDLMSNQVDDGSPTLTSGHVDKYLPLLCRNMTLLKGEGMLNMAQNSALAVGRFLYTDSGAIQRNGQLAPSRWVHSFFDIMQHIRSTVAVKEVAVRGVLYVLSSSPAEGVSALHSMFDTAVSFTSPSVELKRDFAQLFEVMKNGMGAGWGQSVAQYDKKKATKLRTTYGVS